ncbi:hypothetical protein CDL15_Pgr027072 [Punica granatum]|uniref:Xylanase inhibitor C-terminal domain-containing protein n=1 Tax=Punica granatum TaxID=22663 RepID=A0A218XH94_PUNGR|nr:hypothetical protein CDL15_Pgr027072 [Punica granatum]
MTPIGSTVNGFYYVDLEGVSVGEEKVNIDPNVFKLSPLVHGRTILNTGITMTKINRGGYDSLHSKVCSLLDGSLEKTNFSIGGRWCYAIREMWNVILQGSLGSHSTSLEEPSSCSMHEACSCRKIHIQTANCKDTIVKLVS